MQHHGPGYSGKAPLKVKSRLLRSTSSQALTQPSDTTTSAAVPKEPLNWLCWLILQSAG